MGSNACAGLGVGANCGIWDLTTERETELERPTERPEETNRKSYQLFPVSQAPHVIGVKNFLYVFYFKIKKPLFNVFKRFLNFNIIIYVNEDCIYF